MTAVKPITIADVERLNDERRYDLIRGELVSMAPAHFRHGHIALRIGAKLLDFVTAHGLGQVCGAETGFILARDPDVLLAPDAAFVRAERLPPPEEQDRFLPLAPDLAVEVFSPSERRGMIERKVHEYLAAGVPLLWVVYPRQRTVTVYAAGREPRTLRGGDALDGGDVLPGFRLPLAEVFA
jgi:Uma2 family endonuclease